MILGNRVDRRVSADLYGLIPLPPGGHLFRLLRARLDFAKVSVACCRRPLLPKRPASRSNSASPNPSPLRNRSGSRGKTARHRHRGWQAAPWTRAVLSPRKIPRQASAENYRGTLHHPQVPLVTRKPECQHNGRSRPSDRLLVPGYVTSLRLSCASMGECSTGRDARLSTGP